jgi:hypothetical protein
MELAEDSTLLRTLPRVALIIRHLLAHLEGLEFSHL